jgi:predicted nucleic acid-binding protein
MKPVFVDTAALIAIGNRRDTFHQRALIINNELRGSGRKYITTGAIFLEFGNAFSQTLLRPTAIQIMEAIRHSEKWQYIEIDEELIQKGFELYTRMHDKQWGLIDCTSMVVSKEHGITDIFTTDHHFEQAGFSILLRED